MSVSVSVSYRQTAPIIYYHHHHDKPQEQLQDQFPQSSKNQLSPPGTRQACEDFFFSDFGPRFHLLEEAAFNFLCIFGDGDIDNDDVHDACDKDKVRIQVSRMTKKKTVTRMMMLHDDIDDR